MLTELFQAKTDETRIIRRTASRLGPIADWWLKPSALAAIARSARTHNELSDDPGCCWPLLAVEDSRLHGGELTSDIGLLRPAFAYPLKWEPAKDTSAQPGTELDPAVPEQFLPIAESVFREFHEKSDERVSSRRWKLSLAVGRGAVGLDAFNLHTEQLNSVWAALAAGLWSAATGWRPKSQVWATGCWIANDPDMQRTRGFSTVAERTLRAKVEAAKSYGATELFVPELQVAAAQQFAGEQIKVRPLSVTQPDVKEAMASNFASLKLEPTSDDFGENLAHYWELCKLVKAGDERSRAFHRERLYQTIVRKLGRRFDDVLHSLNVDQRPACLVTTVSGSPDAIPQAAAATRVRRCIAIVSQPDPTKAEKAKANVTREWAELQKMFRDVAKPEFREVRYDKHLEEDLRKELGPVLAEFPEGQVIFDITPGTKLHAEELGHVIARERDWLFNMVAEFNERYRVAVPDSQRILMWRKDGKPDLTQWIKE